jgi:hypothetical protein
MAFFHIDQANFTSQVFWLLNLTFSNLNFIGSCKTYYRTITATTAPYCNGFFMRILNYQMSAINYVLLSNDICKDVKRVIIDKESMILSGSSVSSTNNTDHHDITEILLKMALNTIKKIVRFVFFVILIDKRAKWSKYGYHPQFSVYCKFNFDVFLSITTDMFNLSKTLSGPFLVHDLSTGLYLD